MKMTFTKVAVAAIIAGTTLFSGTASAATKDETKATEQYKTFKAGMTIEQAAKLIYGKDYKKQLTKKNGSTVLKKKEDIAFIADKEKRLTYSFYDEKAFVPPTVTSITFMMKKNTSTYRLVIKSLNIYRDDTKSGVRESKMKLYKGTKIKNGMTEKQLDSVLSGSGLGEWSELAFVDVRPILGKEKLDSEFEVVNNSKTYVFPTSSNKRKLVILNYDYKKKTYKVLTHSSL